MKGMYVRMCIQFNFRKNRPEVVIFTEKHQQLSPFLEKLLPFNICSATLLINDSNIVISLFAIFFRTPFYKTSVKGCHWNLKFTPVTQVSVFFISQTTDYILILSDIASADGIFMKLCLVINVVWHGQCWWHVCLNAKNSEWSGLF